MNNITFTKVGRTMPAVQINLKQGDVIWSEAGAMAWKTPETNMETEFNGFGSVFSRILSGEGATINKFSTESKMGIIAFTPKSPGDIISIPLGETKPKIIAQKGSMLCAEPEVTRKTRIFGNILRGLFGGDGFILQEYSGNGSTFLEVGGSIVEKNLKVGEKLSIDKGTIAAFEDTVDYKIKKTPGFLSIFFSGEGLFLGHLEGPGKVWLQTLPAMNFRKGLETTSKNSMGKAIMKILKLVFIVGILVGLLFATPKTIEIIKMFI